MPTKLHKSFSDYFCKMKKPLIPFPSKNLSSSSNWILRGCRHPRTLSFSIPAADDRQDGGQVTLADVDRFLLENFKSIYLSEKHDEEKENVNRESIPCDSFPPLKLEDSPRFALTSELGSSSSSLDAASSSGVTTIDDLLRSTKDDDEDYDGDQSEVSARENSLGLDDFITVSTYSSSPCDEFKRSMQEMMEARLNHHGEVDWEFMEELLLCYMNLNDKKSYKFVLSAFVDLIADYGVSSGGVWRKSRDVGSTKGRGKEKGT